MVRALLKSAVLLLKTIYMSCTCESITNDSASNVLYSLAKTHELVCNIKCMKFPF